VLSLLILTVNGALPSLCKQAGGGQRRLTAVSSVLPQNAPSPELPSNISDFLTNVVVGNAYARFPTPPGQLGTSSDTTRYGKTFRFVARDMDGLPTVSDSFLFSRRIDSVGAVLERKLTPKQTCAHSTAEPVRCFG
jgi:hypothetical protein